ncbi:MAG: hypothetical protein QY310_09900 [Candidatus Jettenia sp. CY-1]|nr:MAG: hypothetical protein QY310_09900 [Candidatus Jettenia sp. CY-1]
MNIEIFNNELFENTWCPLFGNTPIVDNIYDPCNAQILRCFTIIIDVREYFWNCFNKKPSQEPVIKFSDSYEDSYSPSNPDPETIQNYPTWTIKAARFIFRDIPQEINPDLTEPLNNRYWKIVGEVRLNCIPSIHRLPITDCQILGIAAIHKAWAALKAIIYYGDTKHSYINTINIAEEILAEAILRTTEVKLKSSNETINKITKANGQDVKQKGIIPFPTPSGTRWHEVKINFNNPETIRITVGNETAIKTFAEIGFKDCRNGKPKDAWKRLEQFALCWGTIKNFNQTEKPKIEKDIQIIRKILKNYFKIDTDPIPYIDREGYKTQFAISHQESNGNLSKQ